MKLMQNEKAYLDVVQQFAQERLSAAEFLSRFSHLWRCEEAGVPSASAASIPMTPAGSQLYGLLDAINELCETYWRWQRAAQKRSNLWSSGQITSMAGSKRSYSRLTTA